MLDDSVRSAGSSVRGKKTGSLAAIGAFAVRVCFPLRGTLALIGPFTAAFVETTARLADERVGRATPIGDGLTEIESRLYVLELASTFRDLKDALVGDPVDVFLSSLDDTHGGDSGTDRAGGTWACATRTPELWGLEDVLPSRGKATPTAGTCRMSRGSLKGDFWGETESSLEREAPTVEVDLRSSAGGALGVSSSAQNVISSSSHSLSKSTPVLNDVGMGVRDSSRSSTSSGRGVVGRLGLVSSHGISTG